MYLNDAKDAKIREIIALVEKAIRERDYGYIRQARDIAYDNDVFMEFDDNWTAVEDDLFYHENMF